MTGEFNLNNAIKSDIVFPDGLDRIMNPLYKQADTLIAVVDQSKIETDEELVIVKSNVSKLKTVEKTIEEYRKLLNKPLAEATKKVNGHTKPTTEKISFCLSRINKKITSFNELKLAQQKKEAEALKKKSEEENSNREEMIKRISHFSNMTLAIIFGGKIQTSAGEKNYPRPETSDDVMRIYNTIFEKFPKPETFGVLKHNANELFTTALQIVEEIQLRDAKTNNLAEVLNEYYATAQTMINQVLVDLNVTVQKLDKQVEKEIKTLTTSAGTGLRRTITFKVLDISKIPIEYLQLNESMISSYCVGYRDDILKSLAEGKDEIIPGIKFEVESKTIIR